MLGIINMLWAIGQVIHTHQNCNIGIKRKQLPSPPQGNSQWITSSKSNHSESKSHTIVFEHRTRYVTQSISSLSTAQHNVIISVNDSDSDHWQTISSISKLHTGNTYDIIPTAKILNKELITGLRRKL